MTRCKRYYLALFMLFVAVAFLLAALSASAALTVQTDKDSYNLGDQIVASYEISGDQDFSGLLKLSLACTNYSLDFYTVPTNLVAGEKQESNVPSLSVSKSMLGRCYIDAVTVAYDRSSNESGTSNFFNVTSDVSVAVLVPKTSYLPSQTVELSGTVGKSHLLPADILIAFNNETHASNVVNNNFAYSIKLPQNIKSGRHSLGFFVNDLYGNSGSASAEFEVFAVPKRIINTVSSQSVKPEEPFAVSALIYDQANDLIDSDVQITVTNSAGSAVLSASNETGANITISFPTGQEPGIYTLTSSGKGLAASNQVSVEEVERISVAFDNGIVTLKNTGNVEYAKTVNISLAGETSYVILQDVDLKPGQVYEADLTNAVSGGQYTVSFPTIGNASSFENVVIDDKRSLLKKTSDAFGITGKNVLVTSSGKGKLPAMLAPFVLLTIILAIAFYFVKNSKKGRSSGFGKNGGDMDFGSSSGGSSGSGADTGTDSSGSGKSDTAPAKVEDVEEARIRCILEEKHKQQLARGPEQPKSLRNDPVAQKFVRDMMKEKKFR